MATLTVAGTVTDREGNASQAWSASATIGTPLFGSSFGVPPPGGAKVPLGRVYNQPGERPTNYATDSGMSNGVSGTSTGGTIWLSPKVSDAASWFPQLVNSFPADRKVLCSPWHEPENDGTNGHDLTDYTNTYQAFRQTIDSNGLGSRVTLLPILMKGKTETQNRQYLDAVLPYVTALGFDAYNGGIQTPSTYQDVATLVLEKPLRLANEYGLDLWIAETGSGLTPSDTSGSGRIAWTNSLVSFIKSQPRIRGASWWSQGGCAWTTALWNAWIA